MDLVTLPQPQSPQPCNNSQIENTGAYLHCNKPSTIQTFTCFPKLAIELRRLIWKFIANQPRLLTISEDNKNLAEEQAGGSFLAYATGQVGDPNGPISLRITLRYSDSPQPAVLQVCRESQMESLPNV